mmetsp:Transcript_87498/g.175063  ORF Transcript_87498/g.175063 Transcript_87498/m.175063 type:complete len:267 (-) Transcript_87498:18-818(-)
MLKRAATLNGPTWKLVRWMSAALCPSMLSFTTIWSEVGKVKMAAQQQPAVALLVWKASSIKRSLGEKGDQGDQPAVPLLVAVCQRLPLLTTRCSLITGYDMTRAKKKAMRIFIAESFSSSRATAPPSLGVEPAASDNYANSGEEEPVGLSDAPGQVKESDAELGSNGSVHSGVAADEGKQELVTSEGAVEMEAGVVLDADTTPIGGSEQWMSNSKWGSRRSRIRRKKMVVLPSTLVTTKPQALLATDDEIEAWLSNKEANQGTAAV